MSKLKKVVLIILIISASLIIFNVNKVYASTVSLSASKTSAIVGDSVTVTASVTSGAWNLNLTVAGQSKGLVGQTNSTANSSSSTNIVFTANEAKTYVATLTGDVTDYDTGATEDINKTVNIVVSAAAPEPNEPSAPAKSADSSLKSLSISPFGEIKKASSGIYDITVENSLEKVTIKAILNDSKASIVSGNGDFSLEEGTNNFKVVVKAEDGTSTTHRIRIIRKTAEKAEPISPPNVIDETKEETPKEEESQEELGIKNLVITGIELNPKFSIDVYDYKAEFSENSDTLEIIATPSIEGATVEIVGNTGLKIGENLITLIVKSADGNTTKTYQITVTKNEPETIATSVDGENANNLLKDKGEQELKSKIGKIILIAAAAVILVILIGIIAIANTKKNENYFDDIDRKKNKKNNLNKNDFRVAVNEEESYKELEKLSNIHSKQNVFEDKSSEEELNEHDSHEDTLEEGNNNNLDENPENLGVDDDIELDKDNEKSSEVVDLDNSFFENVAINKDNGTIFKNDVEESIKDIEGLYEKEDKELIKKEYLKNFDNNKDIEDNIGKGEDLPKGTDKSIFLEEKVKRKSKKSKGKRFK